MAKLSLQIKAPCPCPLAMNFLKNILKKNGIEVLSSCYNFQGFSVTEVKTENKNINIAKIINDTGFIAIIKEGDKK